ncbi:type IX secretion system membrane protein PorP/SprF [Echinicola jeungdonensis]|uniref:Type IX secretion system membrane protein PorP/SprF n=1 Tax=Echinicola jeungdonensis TaxID=709343 RepID=A0ABV5J1W5_9BACT|nr:type IX secretion system membrane protein PorP/SprF [Echinicola jeungdonensis]MDN3668960.1 type IX secretion system membrane protein PorP/SprF [Echinicola jeungdonensis]
MKKLLLILTLLMTAFSVKAQDIQYSQFYAAPLYLNPAMTGATELTRVGVNYRNQWPGLNQDITSYSAYLDHYFFDANSGVGLLFNSSQQSQLQLSTQEIGLSYAYRLQLGRASYLRFGGQANYVSRDAYFGDLVFGSQLDVDNDQPIGPSGESLGNGNKHQFLDYNFGMFFNTQSIWLGIAGHHLTQPQTSFVEDSRSRLPMKISAHGGFQWDLAGGSFSMASNRTMSLAFNYKKQGAFNQLDLGTQVNLDPVVLGAWYRGIPLVKNGVINGKANHESLIGLLGFSFDNGIEVGYSYDFTISQLNQAQSGGAHEISFRYSFLAGNDRLRGKTSSMPCFKY